jgi:hypothetical protein
VIVRRPPEHPADARARDDVLFDDPLVADVSGGCEYCFAWRTDALGPTKNPFGPRSPEYSRKPPSNPYPKYGEFSQSRSDGGTLVAKTRGFSTIAKWGNGTS